MSDNGELKQEKAPEEKKVRTAEELKAEKVKKFNEDPDRFICLDDVIVGSFRTEKGQGTYIGSASRQEYLYAQADMQFRVIQALLDIEVKRMLKEKAEKHIIPASNIPQKTRGAFGRN